MAAAVDSQSTGTCINHENTNYIIASLAAYVPITSVWAAKTCGGTVQCAC